jgi:hypothetical protein
VIRAALFCRDHPPLPDGPPLPHGHSPLPSRRRAGGGHAQPSLSMKCVVTMGGRPPPELPPTHRLPPAALEAAWCPGAGLWPSRTPVAEYPLLSELTRQLSWATASGTTDDEVPAAGGTGRTTIDGAAVTVRSARGFPSTRASRSSDAPQRRVNMLRPRIFPGPVRLVIARTCPRTCHGTNLAGRSGDASSPGRGDRNLDAGEVREGLLRRPYLLAQRRVLAGHHVQ